MGNRFNARGYIRAFYQRIRETTLSTLLYLVKGNHTSVQSLTSGGVTLNITETSDEDNVFASNTYTVEADGIYLLLFNHTLLHSNGILYTFSFRINGTNVNTNNNTATNISTDGSQMYYIAELSEGDTVSVRVTRSGTSNSVIYDSGNYNQLQVVRLPDAHSYFKATKSSAGSDFSTTEVDVIWDTEVTDTSGVYNNSTGVITTNADNILLTAATISMDPASNVASMFRPANSGTSITNPVYRRAELMNSSVSSTAGFSVKYHNETSWTQVWKARYAASVSGCGFDVTLPTYNVLTGCMLPKSGRDYIEILGCKSDGSISVNTWTPMFYQTTYHDDNSLFIPQDPNSWDPVGDPYSHFYPSAGYWLILFGTRFNPTIEGGAGLAKSRARLYDVNNANSYYGDSHGGRTTNITNISFVSVIKCDGTENLRPECYLEYTGNSPAVVNTTNGCHFIAVKLAELES